MKKTNTKIVIVLLVIALLIKIIPINISKATSNTIFKVISQDGQVGDEITVSIDMANEAEFAAGNFELTYDNSKLEYVSYDKGAILNTGIMALVNPDTENSKISIAYTANPADTNQLKSAGNLLKVKFKIKDNAQGIATVLFNCTILKKSDGTEVENSIEQDNVSILKHISSIELNKSNITLNKGDEEILQLTILPESTTDDKTITWTSSNTKVATVDNNGKVTAVTSGKANIIAKVGQNIANCSITVLAPLNSISLNESNIELLKGQSKRVSILYDPIDTTDNKNAIWTSNDSKIAKVNQDGTIMGISKGTTTITVKVGEKTDSINVNVKEIPLNSIVINKSEITLLKGKTEKISVLYNPEDTTDGKEVTWKSEDEKIATISLDGTITAISEGTTIITAKVGEKIASVKVAIEEKHLEEVRINEKALEVELGNTVQLTTVLNPEETTDEVKLVWTSSDETIATVSEDGIVTALKEGHVKITVTANDTIKDEVEIVITENKSKIEENTPSILPQTGDVEIMIYVALIIVCILGITFIIIKNKKTK